MKQRFHDWLLRVIAWLEPEVIRIIVPKDRLWQRALVLTCAAEQEPSNGEARRHQVYARLIKEFPQTPKRAIALAIEAALR